MNMLVDLEAPHRLLNSSSETSPAADVLMCCCVAVLLICCCGLPPLLLWESDAYNFIVITTITTRVERTGAAGFSTAATVTF